MGDQRRHVGGEVVLPHPDAEDQGTGLAHDIERVRRVGAEDAEGVGALEPGRGLHDGGLDVAVVVQLEQVDDGLGIGLAVEDVAVGDQLLAQGEVVFDDAVVHDGEAPVVRQMRVRVAVGRRAVGSPARVADADHAGDERAVARLFAELRDPPAHLLDPDRAIMQHGQARGVIAAVFEPGQALEQHGRGAARSGKANDSAHASFLPSYTLNSRSP